MSIEFRTLTEKDLTQMHQAFNKAFEGYFVTIKLSYADFVKRLIQEQNTAFKLSLGAFIEAKLVGFIFTSVGEFNEKLSAYNGGTGVIPAYRGQKIGSQMYERLIPLLQQASVAQCLLEVITQNYGALHVYKQLGFIQSRHLKCFRRTKGTSPSTFNFGDKLVIKVNHKPDWPLYQSFGDLQPAFQDSYAHLKFKSALETVVEAFIDDQLVGYVVYQKPRGRISQIAVSPEYRGLGIGTALIQHISKATKASGLNLINIDVNAKAMINFLEQLGFENYLDQYEMVKKI